MRENRASPAALSDGLEDNAPFPLSSSLFPRVLRRPSSPRSRPSRPRTNLRDQRRSDEVEEDARGEVIERRQRRGCGEADGEEDRKGSPTARSRRRAGVQASLRQTGVRPNRKLS